MAVSRTLEPGTPEQVGLSAVGLDAVDGAVREQIDAGVIAGAVTLVARHGRLVRTTVMGHDRLGERDGSEKDGTPLTVDTIFHIYSMTKPITAVAMMILRDEGRWAPADSIAKHLPEFGELRVFAGLDADGEPRYEHPEHEPTMAELMTHTAGFSYGADPTDFVDQRYAAAQLTEASSLAEFAQRLSRLPLAYQPGTKWLYSLSVELQGAVIERLSGQSLGEFLKARIFDPLGMVDTAFFTPPEKLHRRAVLHYTGGEARLQEIANPLFRDAETRPALELGGAGLLSTIGDYAGFCQLLLNGGEWNGTRIVSAEGLTEMMTNHLPPELIDGGFGVGHQRIRPGFGFGYNGVVFSDPELAGIPVGAGTYMWDGAAGTWFWVDPENDLFFIGMIQIFSYSAPPLQARTQTLMAGAIR